MRSLILLLGCAILAQSGAAQTREEIRREAFPDDPAIVDNSPAAQHWRRIVAARRSGDEVLHRSLVAEHRQLFPEKFPATESRDLPLQLPPVATPVSSTDWGVGDILLASRDLSGPLSGGNARPLQLQSDSLGNKYCVFVSSGRDSMTFLKSTDEGITWFQILKIYYPGSNRFQAFDFFITDSSSVFRLGVATTVTQGSNYAGDLWWFTLNDNGTGFHGEIIQGRTSGRGLTNPAIVSDGYMWSTGLTYWYVTYQNVDSTSGVGNLAMVAFSPDWGYNWMLDTARASFNDYDLDIDYTGAGDTIMVLLTNDLTPTNENLRLRKVAFGNLGTGANWLQFNPASTGAPERFGCLVAKRNSSEVLVTYTIDQAGNENVEYAYALAPAGPWTLANPLSAQANNENRCRATCQESQGAYRVSYVSSGGRDTVMYASTLSLSSGFSVRTVVNEEFGASTSIAPDVTGFRRAGGFGGGVVFAGIGPTNVYYDGSNISPTDVQERGPEIPLGHSLKQNYPNPFNPATAIAFDVATAGVVRLTVFDLLGKEVATLIQREMEAGAYMVTFDASRLASGAYFYRLQAGAFVETKKMLLLK